MCNDFILEMNKTNIKLRNNGKSRIHYLTIKSYLNPGKNIKKKIILLKN